MCNGSRMVIRHAQRIYHINIYIYIHIYTYIYIFISIYIYMPLTGLLLSGAYWILCGSYGKRGTKYK